jgi:hypothetical protein
VALVWVGNGNGNGELLWNGMDLYFRQENRILYCVEVDSEVLCIPEYLDFSLYAATVA